MNQSARKEYNNKTFHPEVIDLAFGVLDPKDASEGARIIFEESWIKPYAKNNKKTQQSIIKAVQANEEGMLINQNASHGAELFALLNHLLFTKKPFSYNHIAYDEIIIGKPQKFITATSYNLWPKLNDITIITGTWNKLHKTHLSRFINSHLDAHITQKDKEIFWDSLRDLHLSWWTDWPAFTLKWGRFEKKDWVVKVYGSSWWYWLTSNITATEIFRNVFPNDIINSNTW